MKKENEGIIFYGCLNGRNIQGYAYSVYGMNGLCATITTGCGGGHLPLLLDETNLKEGEQVLMNGEVDLIPSAHKDNMCIVNNKKVYRIRKLTPLECWRLMGYTDEDFTNAEKVNSNTQLYKQAGNAIVKQVLMAIFSQLNIKGVKAWNDMTETEKRDIIKKTTMAGE